MYNKVKLAGLSKLWECFYTDPSKGTHISLLFTMWLNFPAWNFPMKHGNTLS